ncbi:ABC transporter ATP-binding protein [Rothia sp. P13129]|uniref:ABC transporter ATP-binding protein n=1 Tax=Rothia sp. P13129 TaxID=3402664 RepID=UPI003AC0BDAE
MNNILEIYLEEKVYRNKKQQINLLQNFSLVVEQGEKVAVVGESGSGKSTLLNILGLIDTSYSGTYTLFGKSTQKLSDRELAKLRNKNIGFALQESALINSLSIEDNIKLPLIYSKNRTLKEHQRFNDIIEAIGLSYILKKKPLECSGGERARAVFARAIIMKPQVILADEPTASLDDKNKSKIIDLLFGAAHDFGASVITVTHDNIFAHQHDRVIQLERKEY